MKENKNFKIKYLAVLAYLTLFDPVLSQFPRRCTDNESIDSRTCCPTGNDGSRCNEASGRGRCSVIEPELAYAVLNEVNIIFKLNKNYT